MLNNVVVLNEDVINVIMKNINDSDTYVNALYLCSSIYRFLMKTHEDKIECFNLGIIGFYKRYPELPWNVSLFQNNESLRVRDSRKYIGIYDNIQLLYLTDDKYKNIQPSKFLSLQVIEEIIANNLTVPLKTLLCDLQIFSNSKLKFEDKIFVPIDHIDNKLNGLCILDFINLFASVEVSFQCCSNTNLNLKIILDNNKLKWIPCLIAENEGIKIDVIMNNLHLKWMFEQIISNPNFTITDYFKYKDFFDLYVNIEDVIGCVNITNQDIVLHPELLFLINSNINSLSKNTNVSLDVIETHKFNIDYKYFSRNKNITMKYVLENIHKEWDWNVLSQTLER